MRCNVVSGRLTAIWSPSPSVGSAWTPVLVKDQRRAKALAAWWNSTPARLMLLNQRSKTLTYPSWSLAQLRQIRVPTLSSAAWSLLTDAFDETRDMELQPMRHAEDCLARQILDRAAATAIDVEEELVADWRRRLAAEPTITNARADTSRLTAPNAGSRR